jgi:hypothetical protein
MKIVALILLLSAANAVAGDYRAKNNDEIEVFAAVLKSEVSANNWTDNDVICFSIGGKDPSKKLVAALQHRKLNVCSEAEWRRKLACGFSVQFNPVDFDSAEEARVPFSIGGSSRSQHWGSTFRDFPSSRRIFAQEDRWKMVYRAFCFRKSA